MLELRLRQQQRQSEEDSRWLAEEESHLVRFAHYLVTLRASSLIVFELP